MIDWEIKNVYWTRKWRNIDLVERNVPRKNPQPSQSSGNYRLIFPCGSPKVDKQTRIDGCQSLYIKYTLSTLIYYYVCSPREYEWLPYIIFYQETVETVQYSVYAESYKVFDLLASLIYFIFFEISYGQCITN